MKSRGSLSGAGVGEKLFWFAFKCSLAVDVLQKEKPEDLARVWAQFAVAKLNPGTAPIQSALGVGFEEGGRFQVGTLSAKGRFLNMVPMPPVVETVVTEPEERRPLRLGLEATGFGVFPVSKFERLSRAFREETGRDYDGSEAARRVAEQSDTLRPLLEEFDRSARERGSEPAIQREERSRVLADLAEGLRPLVEGIRAGESRAGSQFRDEFSTLKAQAFAISLRDVFEVDFPDPDTELGRLVEQYNTVEPERDPETFQMDWATFDTERDAILEEIGKIDQRVVDALQNRLRLPEEFRDVELQYQQAVGLRDQLGDIPKYTPFPLSLQEKLQDFRGDMLRAREERKNVVGSDNVESVADFMRTVGRARDLADNFIEAAIDLGSSRWRAENISPEYENFIIANREALLLFYPNLRNDRIGDLILAVEGAAQPVGVR